MLLQYSKSTFSNLTQEIVSTIRNITERVTGTTSDKLLVVYGESYGGNIGKNAKQYSEIRNRNFRIFDMMSIDIQDVYKLLRFDRESIAKWRDNNGQTFMAVEELKDKTALYFGNVDTVPYVHKCKLSDIPTNIKDTYEWLCQFRNTNAAIDETGKKQAEGVVIRTADRSFIRKLRFEDYEKTLRKMGILSR